MLFTSKSENWNDIAEEIGNTVHCIGLAEVLRQTNTALNGVSQYIYKDLPRLNEADIDDFEDYVERMRFFAEGIHYAASDDIDIPFCQKMNDIAEEIIAVNPSNYYLDGLCNLAGATGYSNAYMHHAIFLNGDVMNDNQQAESDLIDYYEDDFERSHKIAEATDTWVTDNIDAKIKENNPNENWNSMSEEDKEIARQEYWESLTEDERKNALESYRQVVASHYWDDPQNPYRTSPLSVQENMNGAWGSSSVTNSTHITITYDYLQDPARFPFRQAFDTINHETRHYYQYTVAASDPDDAIVGPATEQVREDFDWSTYDSTPYYDTNQEQDAFAYGHISTS